MDTDTKHFPRFKHKHKPADDEPIKLFHIIQQEIKSITGIDMAAGYPVWMLSLGKQKDFFYVRAEHIAPKEFCEALNQAAAGSAAETLRGKLSPEVLPLLAFGEKLSSDLLTLIANDLNSLLRREQSLFSDVAVATMRVVPQLVASLKTNKTTGQCFACNRLLLEAVFPSGGVARASDTLPGIYAWLHAHPRTALCFSGGGIRSATFGLGVTQGLARLGLLDEFDYLSTVSGGGYVGSWLSAWISREGSSKKVFAALANECDSTPLDPEPEPVRHLREFSNYLTPKLGFMSADTWTLIGTYCRNLLLNWVIFIPALATLLLVPRFCVAALRLKMGFPSLAALAVVGSITAVWSIVYTAMHRPGIWKEPDTKNAKDSKAGSQGRFLTYCFAPLWISAGCFTTLWAWLQRSSERADLLHRIGDAKYDHLLLVALVIAGASLHFVAWCCYMLRLRTGKFRELFGVLFTGALAGVLLWVGTHITVSNLTLAPNLEWYVCLAAPCFVLSFLIAATIFIGVTSRFTTDSDREWWARMGAWLLIGILSWSLFCILVLFGPVCLWNIPRLFVSIGGISSILTLLLGYSDSTPANKKEEQEMGLKTQLSKVGLGLAAPLFIACLIAGISLATSRLFKTFEPDPAFSGAAKFHADDIEDLPLLANALNQHTNALSGYVWINLAPVTRAKLQETNLVYQKNSPLRHIIATNLNDLITNEDFYNASRFTGIPLYPETSNSLLAGPYHHQRLMRFNRMLLQDAFPESIANDQFDHLMITHQTPFRYVVIAIVVFGFIAWILSRAISINRFSLYAVYRNRLIRAYLGASNRRRRANPFSGFDPEDNLSLAQLRPRPFHIINMALNLVTDSNLAWQQRKAESFTASRLHAGNYILGYRDVTKYASHESAENRAAGSTQETMTGDTTQSSKNAHKTAPVEKQRSGLTLGTAVAISGAAASPNSGYHSSPIIAVLMTLFNVRLGAWLGNPGEAGNTSYRHRGPQSAVWHVVKEALGLTDNTAKYVYLSDGGHFENLGLYEMVLRRVHFIVVSDAGCDPDCALEDLGNAIRKIRIDLGVPIEIDQFDIRSRLNKSDSKSESKYCAIGHIDYAHVDGPDAPPGILLYIKPAISGNEPRDVFNYAESSVLFPHEPTSDQWFTESQFESYRMLGMHIVGTMGKGRSGEWKVPDKTEHLQHFKDQAAAYLSKVAAEPLTVAGQPAGTVLK